MGGESLTLLHLTPHGIAGDRLLALHSAAAPIGKPLLRSAERTRMLRAAAHLLPSGDVLVDPGTGSPLALTDPALLTALTLPGTPPETLSLLRSETPLTDVRPVALHTRQALAALSAELARPMDDRRLRSNLVLDLTPGVTDADLLGHTLRLGDQAELHILEPIPRCRMVSLAPGTAEPDPTLLPHLARTRRGRLGLYARPVTPGPLRVGDPIHLVV